MPGCSCFFSSGIVLSSCNSHYIHALQNSGFCIYDAAYCNKLHPLQVWITQLHTTWTFREIILCRLWDASIYMQRNPTMLAQYTKLIYNRDDKNYHNSKTQYHTPGIRNSFYPIYKFPIAKSTFVSSSCVSGLSSQLIATLRIKGQKEPYHWPRPILQLWLSRSPGVVRNIGSLNG